MEADIMQELRRLEELEARRVEAMSSGDEKDFQGVLADDFRQIHGDGSIDDRAGAIRAARQMPRRILVKRKVRTTLLGATALVEGPCTLAVTVNGTETALQVYLSHLARKVGDEWIYFWSQVTLM